MKHLSNSPQNGARGRGNKPGRVGSSMVEAAMWIPILVIMLVGMVELARVSYTYYTLNKILYTMARYLGTQQGLNFCDTGSESIETAKQYVLRGSPEATEAILPNLTSDMIEIRIERRNPDSGELEVCECSDAGCDASVGGLAPDYLVISIPDGYPIRLNIPTLQLEPVPLRPQVRVPYGGT
ncbi:MAG: pilus assembly protein [Acidobacteriia bacterium]|nr:pilus assembly protein [Terriglobia bacterium]